MNLNIVLLEPEIPQNTGNIARTCVAVGAALHLIEPLGFSIDEKQVRRAGLDYWKDLNLKVHKNADAFFSSEPGPFYFSTTKAKKVHSNIQFPETCYIIFGKESAGIPEKLLLQHKETCFRIPMQSEFRSLNLSNTAAIIAYEAFRQHNYPGLETEGDLHRHSWKEMNDDEA